MMTEQQYYYYDYTLIVAKCSRWCTTIKAILKVAVVCILHSFKGVTDQQHDFENIAEQPTC